ncbi:MAG: cobalamin-binding protein [Acidobacteriia bacterium]|nr:cobalamin-binding protein [Terriglobia bacterium]
MIELIDDLSRIVRINAPAQRIVCLVPSITETLFALGAGERIVGITDYCIHPEAKVRIKPRVGGTKNFVVDKVLQLKPDLIIANAEENRRHQVDKLEHAGLTVFVTFPKTVDGCLKMIADMAALTDSTPAAQPVLTSIEQARADARSHASNPPRRVLCPIWKDPYMTINRDTFVDSVIRNCGGMNIFEGSTERYPQFTLEEAARGRPEVVILPTEPYHFTKTDLAEFGMMGEKVPAVRNRRIHIVEGELLSWYGPRLSRALIEVAALLRS